MIVQMEQSYTQAQASDRFLVSLCLSAYQLFPIRPTYVRAEQSYTQAQASDQFLVSRCLSAYQLFPVRRPTYVRAELTVSGPRSLPYRAVRDVGECYVSPRLYRVDAVPRLSDQLRYTDFLFPRRVADPAVASLRFVHADAQANRTDQPNCAKAYLMNPLEEEGPTTTLAC